MRSRRFRLVLAAGVAVVAAATLVAQEPEPFKGSVELITVTATVTDADGRFVSELRQEDFSVLEDGQPQDIAYFASERVPVSLGVLLDVSGSMTAEKMASARGAIDRFVQQLLGPDDELFFMQFATRATVLQEWTRDKASITSAVRRANASGGTAIFDAVAEALPIAGTGANRKKALLILSDGNDTNSTLTIGQLRQMIRESEVLVYALGVDGTATRRTNRPQPRAIPFPFPVPGRPGGRFPLPFPQIVGGGGRWPSSPGERVNGDALRMITDDTGGRTEIVRSFGDLDAATARIADELSKQYALGYVRQGVRDGRWHAIRVSVRNPELTVRARRGYFAS